MRCQPKSMEFNYESARLRYPDLKEKIQPGGTFFLEKYIRVEDVAKLGEGITDKQGFRKRTGGPEEIYFSEATNSYEDLQAWLKTRPHLGGVVNINEFKKYLFYFGKAANGRKYWLGS